MMPWYESQLAGTIIGAVLGFFLAYIPSAIERRRARKALLYLLRVEILSATEQLKEKIAHAQRMLDAASQGRPCQIFTSERRLDEIFTANLASITSIGPRKAASVVGFHQTLARCTGLINALSQDSIKKGEDSPEFCQSLQRLIAFMEDGISTGERIMMELE